MGAQVSNGNGISFLRLKDVMERTGIGRSTIYDWMKESSPRYDPTFPARVRYGKNTIGWVASEIDAWIELRVGASRPAHDSEQPAEDHPKTNVTKIDSVPDTRAADLKRQKEERVTKVSQFLEDQIKRGVPYVSYEEAMASIRMWADVMTDREEMDSILEEVSRSSHAVNGLLLGLLVCEKRNGVNIPSEGFFNLTKSLGYAYTDPVIFLKEQTIRLYEFFETPENKAKGRITWLTIGKKTRLVRSGSMTN